MHFKGFVCMLEHKAVGFSMKNNNCNGICTPLMKIIEMLNA